MDGPPSVAEKLVLQKPNIATIPGPPLPRNGPTFGMVFSKRVEANK